MKVASKKKSRGNSQVKRDKQEQECWYKHLDVPAEVALYYGFTPTESPTITKDDIKKSKSLTEVEFHGKDPVDVADRISLEEKVALLRTYNECDLQDQPQPVMLYFGNPILSADASKKKSGGMRTIFLEAMGTPKSIADTLLIKTSLEILKEEGYSNLCVHLNSVGNRDTMARFGRELTAYYRKNLEELPAHCRQLMKKDIFELLACRNEKCRIIRDSAPKSMNFLSEDSREHFKEVLEYLEFLEIPYEIDHFLVRNRAYSSQTIFEIYETKRDDTCEPLAVGVRYANLGKKMGLKRDVPGVGVRLKFREKIARKNLKFLKPKICFIQLGFEAKLKSLKIIEILRQAKVPMHHGISRDKLTSQLVTAENMKIPYTLIMGQKEALEDTIIVRHMADRSQESVSICDLAKYLKKI